MFKWLKDYSAILVVLVEWGINPGSHRDFTVHRTDESCLLGLRTHGFRCII